MNKQIDITGVVLTTNRLIIVGHFDRNAQSKRVVEKCSFQYIKTTKFETRYDTVENSIEYILYHPERRESRC